MVYLQTRVPSLKKHFDKDLSSMTLYLNITLQVSAISHQHTLANAGELDRNIFLVKSYEIAGNIKMNSVTVEEKSA